VSVQGEVKICNVALARLGADSIRAFDEDSKASRLCNSLYPFYRDQLLESYQWTFARKTIALNLIREGNENGLDMAYYVYQIPSDMLMPVDVFPQGSRNKWWVVGSEIHTNTADAKLLYTFAQDNTEAYNYSFKQALVSLLMAALAPGIVQDRRLAQTLIQNAAVDAGVQGGKDANIGSGYKLPDNDPNKDTFVSPGGSVRDLDFSDPAV
jgi:hypothetical protein